MFDLIDVNHAKRIVLPRRSRYRVGFPRRPAWLHDD